MEAAFPRPDPDAPLSLQVSELALEGVGHAPHLERPVEFRRALLELIGYIGAPQHPAPPTEAIILSSSD